MCDGRQQIWKMAEWQMEVMNGVGDVGGGERGKKKEQKVKMRDETYRHIAIRDRDVANRVQTKIEKRQPKMRNIYRLNEVLHRLIKKKA